MTSHGQTDRLPFRPRIRVLGFGFADSGGRADKSVVSAEREQDQSITVDSFSTYSSGTMRGAEINATGVGVQTSTTYPDGFRWSQTIDTNVPLGGTTVPYVDPRPNDDTKPFYYTDAEHGRFAGTFYDRPRRRVPASGTTYWRADLCLNGVNGTTVTAFDCISYGYQIDSSGTVTLISPTSVTTTNHQSTLSSEFSSWTFR